MCELKTHRLDVSFLGVSLNPEVISGSRASPPLPVIAQTGKQRLRKAEEVLKSAPHPSWQAWILTSLEEAAAQLLFTPSST